jgi:FAD/FMN-containing dehydrogenase
MREKGLLIDQLIETEVVTADGRLLRCNEAENADLFWACRGGGGGNFGINTSFTFQTFPVRTVTAFNFEWTSNLDALLPATLDLLLTMPDSLGSVLVVEVDREGGLLLDLTGQFKGELAELRRLFAPLFRVSKPKTETVKTLDYWEAQKTVLGENSPPQHFHERSRYAFRPMTASACQRVLTELRRWPGTSAHASWKMFLMGGAIARMAPNATAYEHRSALMLTSIELNWGADDTEARLARNQAWLADFHEGMAEHTSGRCYQNFIDDTQPNFLRAYYGENLERLVQVKRAVDPSNVFSYRQGIPLSL